MKRTKDIWTGVGVRVTVDSNYPDGGDGSHTSVLIEDIGGYCSENMLSKMELTACGDLEFNALLKALKYAVYNLEEIAEENINAKNR